MKESILKDKSTDFAVRIVNFFYDLNEGQEKVMSKQILRSGTSIGANIREAAFAESQADFIHKYSIAQKECSETLYWLELLQKTNHITPQQYDSLNEDCVILIKMITATIITCKKNNSKPPITNN